MRELHLIVVDTETGGLDVDKHSIIEIAARHVTIADRTVVAHDNSFCARAFPGPDRPVDPRAAAVNGYTLASWAESALPMHDVAREFLAWLDAVPHEGLIWAGSNVTGFDLPFMRAQISIPGAPKFTHRTLNLESLCFPLYVRGATDGCGLRHLRKWAGLEGDQSHTALQDVDDSIHVLREYFVREVFKS